MSIHHFDTEVAKRVGIPAACVAYCIKFWCQHKAANGKDIHDGKAWVYNSAKAWSELIDYMSEKQIRTALEKLKDEGIIAVRNLNQKQYDQTLWYAYLELETVASAANCPNGKMGFPNGQMDVPEREDGFAQTGRPIPVEIPNTIPIKADAFESASAPPAPPKAENVDYVRADRAFQLFVQAATRQRCWSVPEAMNKTRRASLTARVREVGLEGWERAIRRAEQSPFLTGRTGDKPFGLTLDWMLKPANFTKIIEGNYDDRTHHTATGNGSGARNASRNGSRPDAFDRLAERLSGGPSGPDAWQHDDTPAEGGNIIDIGPARIAG